MRLVNGRNQLEKKINIDDMLKGEDDNGFCSKNNIKINDNTNLITGENSGLLLMIMIRF